MKKRYIQGLDVDTDRLASALRRLADGLESNDVAIRSASTTNDIADPDDLAEFGFSLRYHASTEYGDVTDMVRYATKAYLRFTDEYIADILRGEKSVTVRYQLEREFTPGEPLNLIDVEGDKFAEATVEAYVAMPVERVCDFGIGHYEAGDVDDLVGTLRGLYGDDSIDAETYVTVILFGEVAPCDDYPSDQYL